MINKIFVYDNVNNRIELNTAEILLVKEFAELIDPERNKCKQDPKGTYGLRAFREFAYIWLALSWDSIYGEYDEQDRHQEALRDSGLTEEEFNDPKFRAACRKYRAIQESDLSVKMLRAAQETVNKFIEYFNQVDPLERDEQTGKPVYKVKDIMGELTQLGKVHDELKDLESRVKKETEEHSSIRGGAVEGYEPDF